MCSVHVNVQNEGSPSKTPPVARQWPSHARKALLKTAVNSLNSSDKAFLVEYLKEASTINHDTVASESEDDTGADRKPSARPYKFLSKPKKRRYQDAVVAMAKLLGKSHYQELLGDTLATTSNTVPGMNESWKKAKTSVVTPRLDIAKFMSDGTGDGGEEEPGVGSTHEFVPPILPNVVTVPVTSMLPPPQLPVPLPSSVTEGVPVPTALETSDSSEPVVSTKPERDLQILDSDDLLTSLLKTIAIVYRHSEDPADQKWLLSLVVPHLNMKQGLALFGCSHHAWEAARQHMKMNGPYGTVAPKVIHRARFDSEVRNVCNPRVEMTL